jgi:hypothetical protein
MLEKESMSEDIICEDGAWRETLFTARLGECFFDLRSGVEGIERRRRDGIDGMAAGDARGSSMSYVSTMKRCRKCENACRTTTNKLNLVDGCSYAAHSHQC